jgi:hypothetical protein
LIASMETEQWNKVANPETELHIYQWLVLNKGVEQISGKLSVNIARTIGYKYLFQVFFNYSAPNQYKILFQIVHKY